VFKRVFVIPLLVPFFNNSEFLVLCIVIDRMISKLERMLLISDTILALNP